MNILKEKPESFKEGLRETRIFRHMGADDLDLLLGMGEVVEFEAGEMVIQEASESDEMYIVVKGSVVIEMDSGSGTVYVCTLGPGEVIGEAGLFINVKRTATVRATEGSRLVRIDRAQFFEMLRLEPQSGIRFLFLVIYSLLGRLRESNEELAFERRLDMRQSDVDRMIDELIPPDAQELLDSLG